MADKEQDHSDDPAPAPAPRRRTSDNLPSRQQPVSLQQAIAAAIVTAILGGGLGAGGGVTLGLGGNHDHEELRDMHRIEEKVEKLNIKVESLDSKLVDLRIALAQRGISAQTP